MTRSRRILVIVIAVLVVVAVAGSLVIGALGTSSSPAPSTSPTGAARPSRGASPSPESPGNPSPSPSADAAASALLPVYTEPFTADAAGAESNRVAELMVAFIAATETDASNVIGDDPVSQVVPSDGDAASYFGVLRTLTLDPAVDATTEVESLRTALTDGGWTEQEISDTPEQYLAALTSDADAARSWFLVVAADRSVPGESVVSIQLASPVLP